MKIVDSFIFNNEFDLLDYRLGLLYPFVDHFITCESKFTFSGQVKPIHFMNHIYRYSQFRDKKTASVYL